MEYIALAVALIYIVGRIQCSIIFNVSYLVSMCIAFLMIILGICVLTICFIEPNKVCYYGIEVEL